jgi:hypothetical protein
MLQVSLKSFSDVILGMKSQAEIVHKIFDKIKMPTEKESVYFPRGRNIPDYYRAVFSDTLVGKLNHKEAVLLGQLVSDEIGETYALLSVQKIYDLIRRNMKFKRTAERHGIPSREVILESGYIIPDPVVKEAEGKLVYDGVRKKAEINECYVFDTLNKAGLLEDVECKALNGSISFKNGEASVWSFWNPDWNCFSAFARGPSARLTAGIAVFVKTRKLVEKKPHFKPFTYDEGKPFTRAEDYLVL